jgi:hypothetical protein
MTWGAHRHQSCTPDRTQASSCGSGQRRTQQLDVVACAKVGATQPQRPSDAGLAVLVREGDWWHHQEGPEAHRSWQCVYTLNKNSLGQQSERLSQLEEHQAIK